MGNEMEIKEVEGIVSRLYTNSTDRTQKDAMENVLALIHKQKATIPVVNRKGELICPTCGKPLHPVLWCDCGQLIDWSEDDVALPTEIVKIKGVA